ncbi:MAG: DUF1648 domain-containing protein [Lachnospiraceae bacterium]|nr:DUF1648 domain-containing protein [Lachnospiraceae bacterium]
MNKTIKIIHRVIQTLAIGVPIILLICFLVRYNSLPETIGVHFDGEGNFDVWDERWYGFYPYLVIAITQAIIVLIEFFLKRARSGLSGFDMSEKTVELFRGITLIWIDFIGWGISLFFSMFARSVIWQIPEPVNAAKPFLVLWTIILLSYLLVVFVLDVISRVKRLIRWIKKDKQ